MTSARHHRRRFLKTTVGAIATAAAAPYAWTGRSASAESANDRLNVGAIGVGPRGAAVSRQAGSLGNMTAICDCDRGAAERFAAAYDGKPRLYTDYRELLQRDDVDVVIIGTPDHWHTKICIDAMKAGKDVYCEKPLTVTIEEGKLIEKVVRDTGAVLQVGTQQRTEFNRWFLEAVAIARSGRLGDKLHALVSVDPAPVRGDRQGPFALADPPPELNWDFWQGPAPERPFTPNRIGWNFRWWWEYSGGQVTDWGIHHNDIAMWALGAENTGPDEIEGQGELPPGIPPDFDLNAYLENPQPMTNVYTVFMTFDCTLRFANGNSINLVSRGNEVIIEGDQGRIRVNRGGLTGRPIEEINASPDERRWLDEQVAQLYRGMRLTSHMANFFDCVKDRSLPISDVFTHNRAMELSHTANIAMLLKRKLLWDPEQRVFRGDAQANSHAIVGRPQREPWTIQT
jgi:myo-inositol 2-dehydrogenase / D-chiro-inositol 1-dehydrogenase